MYSTLLINLPLYQNNVSSSDILQLDSLRYSNLLSEANLSESKQISGKFRKDSYSIIKHSLLQVDFTCFEKHRVELHGAGLHYFDVTLLLIENLHIRVKKI